MDAQTLPFPCRSIFLHNSKVCTQAALSGMMKNSMQAWPITQKRTLKVDISITQSATFDLKKEISMKKLFCFFSKLGLLLIFAVFECFNITSCHKSTNISSSATFLIRWISHCICKQVVVAHLSVNRSDPNFHKHWCFFSKLRRESLRTTRPLLWRALLLQEKGNWKSKKYYFDLQRVLMSTIGQCETYGDS